MKDSDLIGELRAFNHGKAARRMEELLKEREHMRVMLGAALTNVNNYPEALQRSILGRNMEELIVNVTKALGLEKEQWK